MSKTYATGRSPTSGSTTWTRAREVSSRRRTITLPMFRKDSATESCSTAEATLGHYACVHAVVCGMKLADLEPRGLTASQSLADIFTTAAVPGRSAALDVCVWPPPLQRQPAEMLHRRHSIVN